MVYGRIYFVPFTGVSVSVAQDLFNLQAATNKPIVIRKVVVTPDDSETNQQFRVRIRRLPATVTNGSGGSAPTPTKRASGDAAASFTARVNDTTRATTSGTATDLNPESFPSQGGFEYLPDIPERPIFVAAEACIVGLEEAPAAAINMSGYAVVEEIG